MFDGTKETRKAEVEKVNERETLIQEKAVQCLRELYVYADQESTLASRQADGAKEVKDFRAMDRHAAYARAMQKVRQRVSSMAREVYLADVTGEPKQSVSLPHGDLTRRALMAADERSKRGAK